MQSNPLSSGGSAMTSSQNKPEEEAKALGSGMFGGQGVEAEELGGRKPGGAGPRKAMQLGKAKKVPNNINII